MSSAPSGPEPDTHGSRFCSAGQKKATSSRTARPLRFLSIQNAHRPELRTKNLPHSHEKIQIAFRLIIRVCPREKLICVVLEMHRDLAKHACSQMNSVIKIFCRGKNDFCLLEIARVQ